VLPLRLALPFDVGLPSRLAFACLLIAHFEIVSSFSITLAHGVGPLCRLALPLRLLRALDGLSVPILALVLEAGSVARFGVLTLPLGFQSVGSLALGCIGPIVVDLHAAVPFGGASSFFVAPLFEASAFFGGSALAPSLLAAGLRESILMSFISSRVRSERCPLRRL